MAHINMSKPAPFGAITVYRIVQAASVGTDMLRAWWIARQTEKALRQLSDRELDDIGLTRGGIENAARGMARVH